MTVQPAERVEADPSVIEALEFEPEIHCSVRDHDLGTYGCHGPTVWYAICRNCADVRPVCDGAVCWARGVSLTYNGFACDLCLHDDAFDAVYRLEPIKPGV